MLPGSDWILNPAASAVLHYSPSCVAYLSLTHTAVSEASKSFAEVKKKERTTMISVAMVSCT